MKGVTIGEGAIIGANSVVISDIPPYCLALGNPARFISEITEGRRNKGGGDGWADNFFGEMPSLR